ncbi:MAG: aminoacetone oxidase family FAD-binding enzyme [Candidatus Absconditicoccaceae bacterium]
MGNDKLYDVIIVGGGAAGLFCSIFADKKIDKLILENSKRVGTKILLSGGGRCNVTNINLDPMNDYVGDNLKVLPSIFHKLDNYDVINRFTERGLPMHEENYGKIFLDCEKSSKLVDLLVQEAKTNNTEILFEQGVVDVEKKEDLFIIRTQDNEYLCKNIVFSSGGKNFPQIGATGIARDIANKLGIQTVEAYPCLSGVETTQDVSALSGSAVDVQAIVNYGKKIVFQNQGPMLFTHRGLSGPAVFDIGLFIGRELENNKLKDYELKIIFDIEKLNEKTIQFFGLSPKDFERKFEITGFRPWELAKATGGGIKLSELSPSLEAKKVPGLYFVGEACDITGRTGGYNLQWAWSSGYVVGKSL